MRSLGVAFMWYAVVQAASAGLPGRGGMVDRLELAGLRRADRARVLERPRPARPGARSLNVINPLAWLTSTTHVGHGGATTVTSSLYPFLPDAVVSVAPWLLGALALYLATVLWSRREV